MNDAVSGSQWTLITPVPPDAPALPDSHATLGAYSMRWAHRGATGDVLGYLALFNSSEGQRVRLLSLYAPAGGSGPVWCWDVWTGQVLDLIEPAQGI
jgi:hypothetical protein